MENDLPHVSFENNKTIPWHTEEMISFRGHLLVYTIAGDGTCIVRFPGGRPIALAEMDRREVVEPRVWRSETKRKKEAA